MKLYLFIPLIALFINFFLWTYTIITSRKNSAGIAYLIYCGNLVFLELAELFFWLMGTEDTARILFMLLAPVYLACNFLFLNFTYALIGKKRDIPYFFFLVSLVVGVILAVSTDLFINVNVMRSYSWGFLPSRGPLYDVMILLIYVLPALDALALLSVNLFLSQETLIKKQYTLVIVGSAITLILTLAENYLFPYFISQYRIPYLSTSFFMVQSLFVFISMVRYRFLTVPIQQIAYDLFSRINDAVIILDTHQNILEINTRAREMLNVPDEIGNYMTAEELFPEDYSFTDDYQNREVTLYSRGIRTTVLVSQSPLIQHSVLVGRLVIMKDITDRKRAEELMMLQHDLSISLSGVSDIRSAAEIIINTIFRMEGVDSGGLYILGTHSRSFDLIYSRGVSRQSIGRVMHIKNVYDSPIIDLFARKEPCYLDRSAIATFPQGNYIAEEGIVGMLMIPVLHREIPISWLMIGTHGPGEIPPAAREAAISTASQIGNSLARFKAEEELLKSSKIESLGIFAGGIAHDFNNLLTSIIGNLSLAKLDLDPDNNTYEILSDAENASLRAKDLTIQLLTFSKGGEPIRKTESIKNLLKEIAEFVLRGTNITCCYDIADNLRCSEIDRGQISQVIHNIVLNARQAMPAGGTVSVTAENAIKTGSGDSPPLKPGDYIKISISDQGDGIPGNYLNKIFDPYFTTKSDGTGLGLAVSYSIIKNHDGYISVKSQPGKGTTFTIYIPASDREPPPPRDTVRKKDNESLKILIMDDEKMILDVGERILARLGHRVTRARNGEEAIALYRAAATSGEPFDLVIMDLTVPGGMGGMETIPALRDIDPDVKAMVSSGYSNNPVMANHKSHGFCGVIVKPYRYDDIKKVLNELPV